MKLHIGSTSKETFTETSKILRKNFQNLRKTDQGKEALSVWMAALPHAEIIGYLPGDGSASDGMRWALRVRGYQGIFRAITLDTNFEAENPFLATIVGPINSMVIVIVDLMPDALVETIQESS
jgi:hypothetical protein